jgi:DNA polymerase IIIc chi subunit
MSRVILFQVSDRANKLKKIIDTVQTHFQAGEPIALFVEDEKGAEFLDELLWKAETFLPHPSPHIWIERTKKPPINTRIGFNLCPTPLLIDLKILYDFEDLTSPIKKNLSSLRFEAYKKAGFPIQANE